jgi:hypothetical protein
MKMRFAVAALLTCIAIPVHAEVEVTLKKSFIEKYKNRVTITTPFLIDKVKSSVNPPTEDGDLHVAGRPVGEIGLMTVVEIQNAKDADDAVTLVRQSAGSDTQVGVTGVWRVWFEHAGTDQQKQGSALQKSKNTNPPHVFEIHPATRIGNIDLVGTLRPVQGYTKPDNTSSRIHMVETMTGTLKVAATTATVRAGGNKPNYISFMMKLRPGDRGFQRPNGSWTQPADGQFVFAKIYDHDNELLAHRRRVAFVKDSEPFQKLQSLQPNECLNILGITRLNLELISWRIKNAKKKPEVLGWNLPYELVAVGVKGEKTHCAPDEDE